MRLTAGFIGVLILAALATGCGGGSDSDSETAQVTKAEFVKQADAICAKHAKELQGELTAYLEQADSAPKARRVEMNTELLFPGFDSQIEELGEVPVPAGEEAKVSAMLEAAESGLAKAEEKPDVLLGLEDESLNEFVSLARSYGLTECGSL
jgi:hypothetical protein